MPEKNECQSCINGVTHTHETEPPCVSRKYPGEGTSPVCDLLTTHTGPHRTGNLTWR